ncbi:unnamed protein product [Clonostachys byssicola]|uniref:Uncharacterized protein n=1 Tax=Clonostachys byssicola TaxID=160290 RepID=A0A9N9UY41_9HYPO|nr:unnamed protein product [Clonostachys byssicola]
MGRQPPELGTVHNETHQGGGNLRTTSSKSLPTFLALPSEILLEILQYYVDCTWDTKTAYCLDLRRTCRTVDDAVSRIIFQRIDHGIILRSKKPLRGRTLKWLLLTKSKIQYTKKEGLFATIHESAAWMCTQSAFYSGILYTYDDYLDAACCAIVARHEGDWILQNAIFGVSTCRVGFFRTNQNKAHTVESDLDQDVIKIHASEMANGALHLAASLGNVSAVMSLLARGVDPNQNHSLYGYALIAAIFSGHVEIVQHFVKHGADLNVQPLVGEPPVVLAAQRNSKDIVDLLAKEGRVQVNNSCKNGLTALLWAVRRGWLDTVQTLLGREDIDPDSLTAWGDSPLATAIKCRHDDIVRLLISRLDVGLKFRSGVQGQLLAAVRRGSCEIMNLLLDKYRLNPNIHLKADKSLLGLAVFWRQKSIVVLLLKHKDVDPNYRQQDTHPTPLMIAIDNGDTKMVELLIAHKGLNPNLTSMGRSLSMLGLVALKGTDVTLRSLLDHPEIGDPNEGGEEEPTPLFTAISRGNTSVVRELLKQRDVDPNRSSVNRGLQMMTPLQHAVECGNRKIVKLLLRRNDLDVNKIGENSHTPLELAVLKEEAPRLTFLLLTRTDIYINRRSEIRRQEYLVKTHRMTTELNKLAYNFKSVHAEGVGLGGGETILLINAKDGRVGSVMQLMRDKRINPNIGDAWERTPLWWAAREGHGQVVEQLLELGDKIKPSFVNVNAQDLESWSPLLCAVNGGYEPIVSALLKRPEIDPNLANEEGWTPLHLSVARENEGIVKQLLAHPKTNVWAKLKVGRTALELTGPTRRRIFNAVKARENRDAGRR